MSRFAVVVVACLCGVVLAGCSSQAPEPPEQAASTVATATSTPTPTPEADGVHDQSDLELGIVFEDAPDLIGDAADVYDWLATYEKEYWRTMTTNQVSPAFDVLGSADVQATMQGVVDQNVTSQVTIAGVFHARIGDVVVDGDTAQGIVCDDYRDVTFADPNGAWTPEQVGFGEPRRKTLTLTRLAAEDRWLVQSSVVQGTC